MKQWLQNKGLGVLLCSSIAGVAVLIGNQFTVIGAPVIAIVIGMLLAPIIQSYQWLHEGIGFASKKVLQYAVILLGFGLNFMQVVTVGMQSLPVIVTTISVALLTAYISYRWFGVAKDTAILVGVGSSICGGSAIAATAPVIKAKDDVITQAIAVIFIFNVAATVIFPMIGASLHMTNDGFALLTGSAVNDTSSVTATATIWDTLYQANTLQQATIVKLTRTLAIIPITLSLSIYELRQTAYRQNVSVQTMHKRANIPTFIIAFMCAALLTTICTFVGVSPSVFKPITTVSKFLIVIAMSAIGLNTNVKTLLQKGGKAVILGGCCWGIITMMSLLVQKLLQLW